MYPPSLRRAALIIAILSSFMTPFMGSSINLALPAIAREFSIDAVVLTWIPTVYLLASAVCLVPFGRLADLFYGRKKVFAFGAVRTMRLLGMMISMGTATVVFALFIGRVEISEVTYPALVKSIGILFLFFLHLVLRRNTRIHGKGEGPFALMTLHALVLAEFVLINFNILLLNKIL